jgi:hypothetical protein
MSVKAAVQGTGPEEMSGDLLDLLLDEIERALFLVDAREDEPGRRLLGGDAQGEGQESETPREVAELRLAVAELVDAFPGTQHDLERVGDRLRTLGAGAGAMELSARAHLLDLARMSLEAFFLANPSVERYESEIGSSDDEESLRTAGETYEALGVILGMLKSRLS